MTRSKPRPARKPDGSAGRANASRSHTKVFRDFVRQLEKLDSGAGRKEGAR